MGWNITEMENTLTVSQNQSDALSPRIVELCPEHFYDGDEPFSEILIRDTATHRYVRTGTYQCHFNSDNMEHMDWLTGNEEVLKLIAATGASGRVCFGSVEGDNSGQFWGVEFTPGSYRRLTGKVHWTPGTSYPG